MTTTISRAAAGRALGAAALLFGATACNDFLDVPNPNVIDIGAIDPVADAGTLAGSAQQNFATSYGQLAMYTGWTSGEIYVFDTFPTRNEFGLRAVNSSNGTLQTEVWAPLSLAAASSKLVLDLELPNKTTNINYARSFMVRGFAFQLMAETFCTGTVSGGPPLTPAAMLDSAQANFSQAITIGKANATADGIGIANASLVGRARSELQAGKKTQAAADAAAVPAGFTFNMPYVDDLANRTRLSNELYQFTQDRTAVGVAPSFWQAKDPRVPAIAPEVHRLAPQDPASGLPFYIQAKYPAYNSPIRLASKLEADYIVAEATGTTQDQINLINARRTSAGLPAYSGATDAASVLTELITQKGFDFFLEGKRMGDLIRVPAAVKFAPVPGAPYIKQGFAPIGNQSCWPLPLAETDNNQNFPKG